MIKQRIEELKKAIDFLLSQGHSYAAEVLYFKLRELETQLADPNAL